MGLCEQGNRYHLTYLAHFARLRKFVQRVSGYDRLTNAQSTELEALKAKAEDNHRWFTGHVAECEDCT